MKFLLVAGSLSLFSLNTFASPFNGYIVKLKNSSHFKQTVNLNSHVNIDKELNTTFGDFVKINHGQSFSNNELEILKNNPDVEYVEPNYIIKVKGDLTAEAPMPKDPSFVKQWGMKNTGKNGGGIFSSGLAGEDINALSAWTITKGSKEIKIAVIDTGVDYTHPDLKKQIMVNDKELNGKKGVDDDGNGYIDDIYGYDFAGKDGDPMDGHGHGTHCAGVIGASHNNNEGIAGVMAEVRILPIKFLSDSGSGETIDAIAAIDYAIKSGVNVMSNSWGGDDYEQSLFDAIKKAEEAGITFVAAAGNDSSDNDTGISFPANYKLSNVISVGSFAASGAKSSFSNYGSDSVHVFAPGSNILSTYKGGGYTSMSGTSMATPHVAGVVGLLLSKENDLTPVQIKDRLINTSVKTEKLDKYSVSHGRVDAYKALVGNQN